MQRLTQTPFGREMTLGLLAHQHLAEAEIAYPELKKWEVFHRLCAARKAYGLSDRDMAVLNALLTFFPGEVLEEGAGLTVFPSNKALAERAHGMAESTLRRHLAALTQAGVILRHDSPNGKRYAARGAGGQVIRAFGFNLRPLLVRAAEFQEEADRLAEAQDALRAAREGCVLLLRDLGQLTALAASEGLPAPLDEVATLTADARRILRRNLTTDELCELGVRLDETLAAVQALFGQSKSQKMSGKDDHSERHYQNSNTDTSESEPCLETSNDDEPGIPNIPLVVVAKACQEAKTYTDRPMRHWPDLIAVAHELCPMMGISRDAWEDACGSMGAENAGITVLCILERMQDIRSPGGYLRSLTRKAQAGQFSTGPMVMALLNVDKSVAA